MKNRYECYKSEMNPYTILVIKIKGTASSDINQNLTFGIKIKEKFFDKNKIKGQIFDFKIIIIKTEI